MKDWRDLMDPIRSLAQQHKDDGKIEILQRGEPVPSDVPVTALKGPIRLRRLIRPD